MDAVLGQKGGTLGGQSRWSQTIEGCVDGGNGRSRRVRSCNGLQEQM
jgi:hypothetical protein